MKKKNDKVKKTNNKVKNFSSRGYIIDLGSQQLTVEVFKLLESYSKTGEIELSSNEMVSQVYEYINRNKKKVIEDEKKSIHSLTIKAILSFIFFYTGIVSFVSTLIIFALTFGVHDIVPILTMSGLGSLGFGLTKLSFLLKKSNNTVVVENLLKDMEDKYGVECLSAKEKKPELSLTQQETIQDKFLEEVKAVLTYAKINSELDFANEIDELTVLAQDYIIAKREFMRLGKDMPKFNFLTRLVNLELKVFSKRSKIGLKPSYLLSIKGYQLVEHLKFMGLKEETITQDSCLTSLFKEISRISQTAYEGCEREFAQLFKIAQEYVYRTYDLKDPSVNVLPEVSRADFQLFQELGYVEKVITANINLAIATSKKTCLNGNVATSTLSESQVKTL